MSFGKDMAGSESTGLMMDWTLLISKYLAGIGPARSKYGRSVESANPYTIPYHIQDDLAFNRTGRRTWVRYERDYSNSMWHAGYKMLPDGRWLWPIRMMPLGL